MATIHYKGQSYEPRPGETLLSMFLRYNVKVPYSCGGGSCHFCMHRCLSGNVPAAAQKSLRSVYRENRFFLLCCCVPEADMQIELPTRTERFCQMEILSRGHTTDNRTFLELMPFSEPRIRNGQYLILLEGNNRLIARILPHHETPETLRVVLENENTSSIPDNGAIIEAQGPFSRIPESVEMIAGVCREFPEPDLSLWQALNQGTLLTEILKAFYHRVFRDALLGPFFTQVTESRLIEKQYNFLRQAITGDKVFFGERPRNAHHWMVISDALFDHRTAILHQVLDEFSVPSAVQKKLLNIEEYYRQDIVKEKPWHRVLFGKPLPIEGYEPLVLDEASLCDGCEAAVARGEAITYHVRTGKIYCRQCRAQS